MSSFGARLRPDHGERVRLEGQHRVVTGDHRPVADVDAIELADRDPPGPRLDVAECVTCIGVRKAKGSALAGR